MVNREIVLNGYTTQLGIFHDNADNPFNLGSDLMEPFRILVDRIVRRDMPDKFETDEKHRMLELVNTEVSIAGKKEFVPNAIKLYVRSIFDAINDNDISEIKFYQV
jgi:CRISPR/Cas system-associated endonuclease Cas1